MNSTVGLLYVSGSGKSSKPRATPLAEGEVRDVRFNRLGKFAKRCTSTHVQGSVAFGNAASPLTRLAGAGNRFLTAD
jgi:hypothetical protein